MIITLISLICLGASPSINGSQQTVLMSTAQQQEMHAKGRALHQAIEDGDLKIFRDLIAQEAPINYAVSYHNYKGDITNRCLCRTITNLTPLHRAVEKGNIEIVTELLQTKDIEIDAVAAFEVDYNNRVPTFYVTPLMMALTYGDPSLSPDDIFGQEKAEEPTSKVYLALIKKYEALVKLFVDHKAALTKIEDTASKQVLYPVSFAVQRGSVTMLKTLLDAGADCTIPEKSSPLECAIYRYQAPMVNLLLQHGVHIESPIDACFGKRSIRFSPLGRALEQYESILRWFEENAQRVIAPIMQIIEDLLFLGADTKRLSWDIENPDYKGLSFDDYILKHAPLENLQQARDRADKRREALKQTVVEQEKKEDADK